MTKIKIENPTPIEHFLDNIEYSPYWNVAHEICERRGIEDPNIFHIFLAMDECARIDNKINKKER